MEKPVNFIPCVFVNGLPIKNGPIIGYCVTESRLEGKRVLNLSVVREIYYEHPDTNEALLQVKESQEVLRAFEGDSNYSKLYLLLMAQDVVNKITIG